MHRHRRARGKILFEALCALLLAASFASAWDQTGSSALLTSAAIMALFATYWSFGLFAREPVAEAAQVTAAVADAQEVQVEPAVQEEAFAREAEVLAEPEPVVTVEPKKRRTRKAQKAAAAVEPVVEPPEPVALEESVSDGLPVEQLFDAQPFVRQPRPAFGRKARGPRPVAVG